MQEIIPSFKVSTVMLKGREYYRTYLKTNDGRTVTIGSRDLDTLYEKYEDAKLQIANDTFNRESPSVREYCEKWLYLQSANLRYTTMVDYTSKVKCHIIEPLGDKKMSEVTADDIKMALIPVAELSESVYKSVVIIYKSIFDAAEESKLIKYNPTKFLPKKLAGKPTKEKEALSDEQIERLLDAVKGLQVHTFIMIGLYAGLRREEILALQWDCVNLNAEASFIMVRRAWHTEGNRPVILSDLKTGAAERDIAIPDRLVECLREAKKTSRSAYVIANSDGGPLSYTQYKRLWHHVQVRIVKPRPAKKKVGGKYVKYTIYPVLGEYARNNGKKVQYVLDFDVTPHQLRHTYITNLIAAGIDPKTVQYLAGHKSSKITMDIYAKVKYNKPDDVVKLLQGAFSRWNGEE